ncbi:hypothetical protein SAMN05216525_11073 [Bradyrhizobium sp. Gha]|nr:hypothetical protein SAMN05216525_11073 [Bradyrhizobium sp. Gha]
MAHRSLSRRNDLQSAIERAERDFYRRRGGRMTSIAADRRPRGRRSRPLPNMRVRPNADVRLAQPSDHRSDCYRLSALSAALSGCNSVTASSNVVTTSSSEIIKHVVRLTVSSATAADGSLCFRPPSKRRCRKLTWRTLLDICPTDARDRVDSSSSSPTIRSITVTMAVKSSAAPARTYPRLPGLESREIRPLGARVPACNSVSRSSNMAKRERAARTRASRKVRLVRTGAYGLICVKYINAAQAMGVLPNSKRIRPVALEHLEPRLNKSRLRGNAAAAWPLAVCSNRLCRRIGSGP